MIELVVREHIPKNTPIEPKIPTYKKTELYRDYEGDFSYEEFTRICDTFFEKVALHILKGGRISTPIGQLYLERRNNNPNTKYVDVHKAKNPDKYDSYYRENPHYDAFQWAKKTGKTHLEPYTFRGSRSNLRMIPIYEPQRTFTFRANAL